MLQEPKNYHLITDFTSYKAIYEEGHTFCAFDTETTGLKAESERVIEIGAVKFNKNGIIADFGTLIDPEKKISPKITEITNITNEMLAGKPKADEAIKSFLEFSKDCILIAHNAPFDLRFVNYELIRLDRPTLTNPTIDNLRFTKWAFPTACHWNQPFLAEMLGIEIKQAHRAADDARVCMEIFLKTLESKKVADKSLNRSI